MMMDCETREWHSVAVCQAVSSTGLVPPGGGGRGRQGAQEINGDGLAGQAA